MKAMILAAGLGLRLRPLTDTTPKALVKVNGRTLLDLALEHLRVNGIAEVIINVHHLAEQIIDYLESNGNFGMKIAISDETEMLLDTGGGLVHAAWFFNDREPFVVRNVDVISDMDLVAMMEFHIKNQPLATLAVRNRETSRYLLFRKKDHLLCGWNNIKTGESIIAREGEKDPEKLAFSGIQVIDPGVFELVKKTAKFSLTEMYVELARNHKIVAYVDNASHWEDAGKQKK